MFSEQKIFRVERNVSLGLSAVHALWVPEVFLSDYRIESFIIRNTPNGASPRVEVDEDGRYWCVWVHTDVTLDAVISGLKERGFEEQEVLEEAA